MKSLWKHLVAFFQEDFHLLSYLFTGLLLAGGMAFAYGTGFVDTWVYAQPDGVGKLLRFTALFATPYLAVLLVQAGFGRGRAAMRSPGFWFALLVGLAMVIVTAWAPWHKDLVKAWVMPELQKWGIYVFWSGKRWVFVLIPMVLYYLLVERERRGWYGLVGGAKDTRAFAWILLALLPIIVVASFSPAFIQTYPFYKPGRAEVAAGVSPWLTCSIAELAYASGFFFVEWLYRGFFIFALSRWLGPHAVLPMVALYATIHFGKPMGEAIASVFGGLLLGAIAYRCKSIWGGVIVHVGIAMAMDLMGFLHRI
jgi:hypothetical protein